MNLVLLTEPLRHHYAKEVSQAITANASNPDLLRDLFSCLRLICRIFYSLNYLMLPMVFEDHMQEWMVWAPCGNPGNL